MQVHAWPCLRVPAAAAVPPHLWLCLHDGVAADDLDGLIAQHIFKVVQQLLGLCGGWGGGGVGGWGGGADTRHDV
jgi:hypothetical protein